MNDADEDLAVHLTRAISAIRELPALLRPLERQPTDTSRLLRDALRDPTRRRSALLLASMLDPSITMLLLDIVVDLAASDRDAVLVRQILGRAPEHEVSARVPPVVEMLLDQAADHDYRRYAELLVHLGLTSSLRDLCVRAAASPDPGIREVADEFEGIDGLQVVPVSEPEADGGDGAGQAQTPEG